jgi:prepilin-type N-terminal cleavage/methylation domain-containing protein
MSVRSGFTLIELLVTVVLIGIIAIAAFSFMGTISTVFTSQEQATDAQSNLRFAMDTVSRDVKRAGYLGTPNMAREVLTASIEDGICPNPTGLGLSRINAIRIENDDAGAYVYSQNGNRNIEPDALTVSGTFSHNEAFESTSIVGNTITFDQLRLAAILAGGSDSANKMLFENLFRSNRLVRVWKSGAPSQLTFIRAAAWGNPSTLTVDRLVETGNAQCGIDGVAAQGYKVSVIEIVRYHVVKDPVDDQKMDLMRTEIDPTTGRTMQINIGGTQTPNSVPVAEYVVDFQVWVDGDMRADRDGSVVPRMSKDKIGDDQGGLTFSWLESGQPSQDRWHRVRTVHVQIAVRSLREDPRWQHRPRTRNSGQRGGVIYGPLLSFNLDADEGGAARVIVQTDSFEVSNLSFRNLQ